ncbi:MAG: DUF255 domain-containing protein [Planctomycetota bacterium]|jgi:thioredoxin-related protein|nr:DUF255 domain-containing protein [Planctomycetota bacterium]
MISHHSRPLRLLSLLAILIFASPLFAAEIAWQPLDLEAAVNKAAMEKKVVHLFVEKDDCPPCDIYKQTHLTDPAYVDFVNTLFVNIRAHEDKENDRNFLDKYGFTHAAAPRFYLLGQKGQGLSMSPGITVAPPLECVAVMRMAEGQNIGIDPRRAAELAERLQRHAKSLKASGKSFPNNPLRPIAIAFLEAAAWAQAGRLDQAEGALGADWAGNLAEVELLDLYANFWLAWQRNFPGVLQAAFARSELRPEDPDSLWLLARAFAVNQRFSEAVRLGEALVREFPSDPEIETSLAEWRRQVTASGKAP